MGDKTTFWYRLGVWTRIRSLKSSRTELLGAGTYSSGTTTAFYFNVGTFNEENAAGGSAMVSERHHLA